MEFPLDFSRAITSELLAMTLVVAVGCLAAVFRPSRLWPSALVVALLVFTRPEFLALPAILLVLVGLSYRDRRTQVHALLATASIYALVGLYVLANNAINGYPGFTVISRINSLGKAMQYGMHDEAPGRYARLTASIDAHLRAGREASPYRLNDTHPIVSADDWKLAGDYGRAVLRAAPLEYGWKTAELAARQKKLLALSALGLLVWALVRTRGARLVGFMALVCLYDVVMVSLGAYDNYERLYAPVFPLTIVLIVSIAVLDVDLVRRLASRRSAAAPSTGTALGSAPLRADVTVLRRAPEDTDRG